MHWKSRNSRKFHWKYSSRKLQKIKKNKIVVEVLDGGRTISEWRSRFIYFGVRFFRLLEENGENPRALQDPRRCLRICHSFWFSSTVTASQRRPSSLIKIHFCWHSASVCWHFANRSSLTVDLWIAFQEKCRSTSYLKAYLQHLSSQTGSLVSAWIAATKSPV